MRGHQRGGGTIDARTSIHIEGSADEKTLKIMEARLASHARQQNRELQNNFGSMQRNYANRRG
jgi:hypothetical protein